jgi:hypothetical protein
LDVFGGHATPLSIKRGIEGELRRCAATMRFS